MSYLVANIPPIEVYVDKKFLYDFQKDENGNYYGESRIGVSRKNPVNIHSLMDVYLDEKRLWNKQINKLK